MPAAPCVTGGDTLNAKVMVWQDGLCRYYKNYTGQSPVGCAHNE